MRPLVTKLTTINLFCLTLTLTHSPHTIIEHLGLLPPQDCNKPYPKVTSYMRPAPTPNEDETDSDQDQLVADPLSEECDRLWNDTARKNREILTELFRPTPTNLVRSWSAYDVRLYPFFLLF
jgi:hypothetical protein